tara:strand:- start:499 stop:651 length:153 start_codon:yes stop_codon:yes gene_type:complete
MDKSKFRKKDDFVFSHLDGTPFTTKQFGKVFKKMVNFTKENEQWGKSFVP